MRTAGVVCLLALIAASCGYSLQGTNGSRFADPSLRIDLRPFTNASLVPDAGAFLAGRLREELRRMGFRGKFDRAGADYLVEGTVKDFREEVVSHDSAGFSLEHRLTIYVNVRVVEVVKGRLLWKEEGLTEGASYFAGSDFQYTESNRRAAIEEVCRRMAKRIGLNVRIVL
ncbi:MAG: LPS assembly lipoprotein LptE [Deltaproteobacteria bacterium]|nr:LPS assembly lipoprotein LptE [Candidatus Deferrimicrobiaceae bacterium]